MEAIKIEIDPKLDLVLERTLDVSVEDIWQAWTKPENIQKWFCPKPWQLTNAKIDLRAGGIFGFTMEGPNGENITNSGCYLEVIENRRLIWTSALKNGFRPQPKFANYEDFAFTAVLLLEPTENNGTKYTAIAIHADEESCNKHAKMGFKEGWGICCDQLVNEIKQGNIR